MTTPSQLVCCFFPSPVGRLRLVASSDGLAGLYFPEHRRARHSGARELGEMEQHPVLERACRELAEYFAGERSSFEAPLAPPAVRGGTEFQLAVWSALSAIPFGETRSYGEIARYIGRPGAVRAVGAANALNPLSIFVPCHRVIGGSGALTGYAGGIEAKRWLLAHETQLSPAVPRSGGPKITRHRRNDPGKQNQHRDRDDQHDRPPATRSAV